MSKGMDLLVKKYDTERDLDAIWRRILRDTMSPNLAWQVCTEIETRRGMKTQHS